MDKQMKRNKICFGLGTVGRDALYSLVSMYLLVHLTDVVGFSDGGLAVIGVMLTLFGIFDAEVEPGTSLPGLNETTLAPNIASLS